MRIDAQQSLRKGLVREPISLYRYFNRFRYGGVTKRMCTGELPLTEFPGGVAPPPQPATFNTVAVQP